MTALLKEIPAFDIFVIIFLLITTVLGGIRGIYAQITSIISMILSWLLASRYSSAAESFIPLSDELRGTVAVFVVFFLLMLAMRIVARIIGRAISGTVFKEVNRQLGALFGLAKGFIVCLIVTFFAVITSAQTRNLVIQSQSGRFMVRVISAVGEFIPENEHHAKIREALDEFTKAAGGDPNHSTAFEEEFAALKQKVQETAAKAEEKISGIQKAADEISALSDSVNGWTDAVASAGSSRGRKKTASSVKGTSDAGGMAASSALSSGKTSVNDIVTAARKIFSSGSFQSVSPVEEESEGTSSRSAAAGGRRTTVSDTEVTVVDDDSAAPSIIDRPTFSITVTAPPF